MQLRLAGVLNITQVEFAVLEANGRMSVLKKTPHLPVTPKDLGISTSYQGMALEIIKDADIIEHNLIQNNLDFG